MLFARATAISVICPVGLERHLYSKQDTFKFDASSLPLAVRFPQNKVRMWFPELLGILAEYLKLYRSLNNTRI